MDQPQPQYQQQQQLEQQWRLCTLLGERIVIIISVRVYAPPDMQYLQARKSIRDRWVLYDRAGLKVRLGVDAATPFLRHSPTSVDAASDVHWMRRRCLCNRRSSCCCCSLQSTDAVYRRLLDRREVIIWLGIISLGKTRRRRRRPTLIVVVDSW